MRFRRFPIRAADAQVMEFDVTLLDQLLQHLFNLVAGWLLSVVVKSLRRRVSTIAQRRAGLSRRGRGRGTVTRPGHRTGSSRPAGRCGRGRRRPRTCGRCG